MKKIPIIAGAIIIVVISAFYFRSDIRDFLLEFQKSQLPKEIKYVSTSPDPATSTNFIGINLAVPFSAQSPFGDWSLPYLEACEETSALLVDRFYKNETLSPEIAKEEILKIVEWENKTLGYYEHTTAKETGRILIEYFGYKRVDVKYDISLEDIKTQIIAGRPVIVPLAGRMMNNPYYRQPGPIYHMLVIKGITKDGNFITNDVGTKRGANYVYDANVLFDAIHDAPFGGGELTTPELEKYIPTGRKAIIVVYPN
jgi:hypothetical protein